MPNKKISQLDVRSSPTLADLLAIADPSTGYAYKITGTNLQTVLEIPNKVPYTGATAAVNLGAYGITSDYLQLSTTPTASGAVGRTLWNDQIGSTQTTLKGGSVVLKNGVDLVARVVNKVTPAATLTKATYKAVRVSGAQGQRLAIAYAQANNDNNSADTIGLVCETIAANQEGFIITVGQLTGINTTGSLQGETWADGDVLYLSPTTAGNLTNIKPTGATGHIVVIGYVEYAHANNGSIYVKIMNGWELDELHNVYINAVANNDVLVYESSSTLWKNKSIATILGYTPANDSLVVHLAGAETITGVKTFQNALQTTAGNNLLNTGGGNTVIGYTADPASSATYKLDVNGQSRFVGNLLSFNGSNLRAGLYTSSGWGILDLYYGSLAVRLDPSSTSYMCLGGANLVLGATTGNNSAILYLNSTAQGFRLPNMTTIQKNAIVSPATSLLVYDTDLAAFQYYTGSAWAGLGGGISGSGTAGQVTYWSGTSAVTGSSNLVWDNTNGRLGIGTSSPINDLSIVKSTTAAISIRSTSSTEYVAINFYNSANNIVGGFGYGNSGVNSTYSNKFYLAGVSGVPISFIINNSEYLRMFPTTGNLMLQNGGTFTDGGQRLQVIGSMRVGTTAASAMYWDDTNNRLGIGTSSPGYPLHVTRSSGSYIAPLWVENTGSASVDFKNVAVFVGARGNSSNIDDNTNIGIWQKNNIAGNYGVFNFYNSLGNLTAFLGAEYTNHSASPTGNFLMGTVSSGTVSVKAKIFNTGNTVLQNGGTFTDGGYRLDVQGTMRATGQVRLSGLPTSATGLFAGDLWNNLGIVSIV